jgi:hypothetical protein
VRRHWFLDVAKTRNDRLVVSQEFDKDLRMLKQAILEPVDQNRFETGIASLLFLLGFCPAVQVETNSPDLIVTTPAGKLVVLECTIKIADFNSKLGKLVDRRGIAAKALQRSHHNYEVHAVLVSAQPRDQIAVDEKELREQKVILLTKDDLTASFDRVRFPSDPDQLLNDAAARQMPTTIVPS